MLQKAELVAAYKVEIASLIGASSLELQAEAPTDSAAFTPIAVDDTTFLFMRILGMVDFTAQLAKMNREIEQASNRIGLLKLKMSGEGYTKAPEAVRLAQAEKVSSRIYCLLFNLLMRLRTRTFVLLAPCSWRRTRKNWKHRSRPGTKC